MSAAELSLFFLGGLLLSLFHELTRNSASSERFTKPQIEKASGGQVPAPRLWTTLLVCAFLRDKTEHFLLDEPGSLADAGTTLLDNAHLWLEAAVEASPRLAAALPSLTGLAEAQARGAGVMLDFCFAAPACVSAR